jgi:hypothetical protein
VAALAFVDFLYVFALPIVRHKLHNVFKILHVLSSAMIVLCVSHIINGHISLDLTTCHSWLGMCLPFAAGSSLVL